MAKQRTDSKQQRGLDYWADRLCQIELPVLAGVIREVNTLTADHNTSAAELSEVILRDAALTAKVLRVANSVHFRGGASGEISTISRAVVQLGFKSIRAICLSVMLIDSLLKKDSKERMLEWMARGFHAAVQAENMVREDKPEFKEDVFISALLLHLGEMAFWSSRSNAVAQLDDALPEHSTGEAELEKDLLGATMSDITAELAHRWQMSDTLKEALNPGGSPGPAVQAVLLGEEISLAAETGWDSQAMQRALEKVAVQLNLNREEARQVVMHGAEEAASVAVSFGANKVCHFIPSTSEAPAPEKRQRLRADPQLQLKILRELANVVDENIEINTLFQMLVEGVHRGIGLERVALCLIDARKQQLQAKYVLGEGTEPWREELRFPMKSEQDNLLSYVLHSRQTVFNRRGNRRTGSHLVDARLGKVLDTSNCLIAALYADNRPVGILLADRGMGGDAIGEEQHESFLHFSQQGNMGLSLLARNTKK